MKTSDRIWLFFSSRFVVEFNRVHLLFIFAFHHPLAGCANLWLRTSGRERHALSDFLASDPFQSCSTRTHIFLCSLHTDTLLTLSHTCKCTLTPHLPTLARIHSLSHTRSPSRTRSHTQASADHRLHITFTLSHAFVLIYHSHSCELVTSHVCDTRARRMTHFVHI